MSINNEIPHFLKIFEKKLKLEFLIYNESQNLDKISLFMKISNSSGR